MEKGAILVPLASAGEGVRHQARTCAFVLRAAYARFFRAKPLPATFCRCCG